MSSLSAVAAVPARAADAPAAQSRSARAYAILLGQLALLLAVFRVFRLEDPAFILLSAVTFGGFAIHYWLPFAWKEWFSIALASAGAYLLLEWRSATLLLGLGLVVFGIVRTPLPYALRVLFVAALFAGLLALRAANPRFLPPSFLPVAGSIFMFRLIIYLYDLRYSRKQPVFREFASYFFLLPNYYFLLFPVIDFQTMRKSYFQRNAADTAQEGIRWMVRGAIQLLLYRLVYYFKPAAVPDAITSLPALISVMFLTYMLYLRVSGTFHIAVGMLHLFGYNLPETHRRYLLASSLTDFWRRINIYWKDFMVKLFYFPVYFKLRKKGEVRAQVIATSVVFVATWILHSYQFFWLRGTVLLTWPDTLFWMILGACVVLNLLLELKRKRPVRAPVSWPGRVRWALQVMATLSFITLLWSLWNAPSLAQWGDLLTWWQVG